MPDTLVQTAPFLLIEDDADDALLTRRAFEKANIWNPVDVAASSAEAWAYLTDPDGGHPARPLCILLDLNMPGEDGRELLAKIRAEPSLNDIPVVVISTSDFERDVDTVRKLGAKHYIIKPIKAQNVLQIVATLPNLKVVLGNVR